MELFVANTIFGLYIGSAYAIAASGLVLTYTTTRVFNLAHGAISMFMAFVFWQFSVAAGIPVPVSIFLVVFVAAPLFGLLLERIMRDQGDAPISVSLVVTVALFMAMIGVATQFWPNDENRSVPFFFGYNTINILGARVGYQYIITIFAALIVAASLYFLLNRTRIGTSMRAAVDNRELLELFGANANRTSMLSWSLGSMLAALGGVLLAAYTGLDYYSLTFLVVAAFAAAMLGRLSSLPLTYVGALGLGLASAYIQSYLGVSPYLQVGIQSSLPTFMLFVILLFVPQVRLRVGQVKGIMAARIPSLRRSLEAAGFVLVTSVVMVNVMNPDQVKDYGLAIVYGMVMLSLVLLTGYGGYMSLAQFTFVGIGASTVAKMDTSSPLAVLVAVGLAVIAGALVSLSVLRLTGLYLALATLAFGQLMDKLVFSAPFLFGANGSLPVKRLDIPIIDLSNDTTYVIFMLAIFTALGIGMLALRRGPIGRLLIALRDSPAACGTLGLNQRWFRVAVFSASAGIAGLAGALLAGLQELAAPLSFQTIASLPAILVAVVAGVTTITGAFVGGIMLMITLTATGGAQGMIFIILSIGAILLAKDPNGLVNMFFKLGYKLIPFLPASLRRWLEDEEPAPSDLDSIEDDELGIPHYAAIDEAAQDISTEVEVAGHGVA